MYIRAICLVTAALFSGVCLAQQASSELELNLDQFEGQATPQPDENLELNLDQFKETESQSLPADPLGTENSTQQSQQDENLDLNLNQFDKPNADKQTQALPQAKAETSPTVDTTGTSIDSMGAEGSRFKHTRALIVGGIMVLAFLYWLSRRRRNRRV